MEHEANLGPLKPEWDRVPHDSDMTEFRRATRRQQARWRSSEGHSYGEHPPGNPNGSTLDETSAAANANFLSPKVVQAVESRLRHPQKHQTLDSKRLRANLLSSMPMCFNLFGELHADLARLTATGQALWEIETPGREVLFEWSPGRIEPGYTKDRTAFDAALFFEGPGEAKVAIGIETKFHERAAAEKRPDESTRMPRYREITETSGIFEPGWEAMILGTPLQQIWRDHLLILSMLQHPSGHWATGSKYILVYPEGNTDFARLAREYTAVLTDAETFRSVTVEELMAVDVLHDPGMRHRFQARYMP
ncbi:PGN_0703 family putative restriction endonuclease [Nocardioides sp. AX2bis]|uniref:PGN_0703 family putative restriction endonuclease n=1 Tax=Nocardioides sp. AX2bis TaxID=2653157 RepID=UPI0012F1D319|nr:hypothetical protein [Nocardioides sp. AX2bis]VXC11706.1 conserved hypothetical protein [Nocardioides sp. AX2bis]